MIAKDGKHFDLDYMNRDYLPSEVEIIQYRRPDGQRQRLAGNIGEDYVEKTKDLIVSAEMVDASGQLILYIRKKEQSEEDEYVDVFCNCVDNDNHLRSFIDDFLSPERNWSEHEV